MTETTDHAELILRGRALAEFFGPGLGNSRIVVDGITELVDALTQSEYDLDEARAEAWAEGEDAGQVNAHERRPWRLISNPYPAGEGAK